MLQEKAGAIAGQIWEALNGNEGLTQKGRFVVSGYG